MVKLTSCSKCVVFLTAHIADQMIRDGNLQPQAITDKICPLGRGRIQHREGQIGATGKIKDKELL